jgi:hypothetical protein
MASKITLNVNSIYAVSAIVTVTIGIAVGSVIYCTATAVSGLKERCNSLEKRVDYLDGIVKERDSHTKELFDAKLAYVKGGNNKCKAHANCVHDIGVYK